MICDLAWAANNKSQWYDPTCDGGSRNAQGMTVGILRDAVNYERLLFICVSKYIQDTCWWLTQSCQLGVWAVIEQETLVEDMEKQWLLVESILTISARVCSFCLRMPCVSKEGSLSEHVSSCVSLCMNSREGLRQTERWILLCIFSGFPCQDNFLQRSHQLILINLKNLKSPESVSSPWAWGFLPPIYSKETESKRDLITWSGVLFSNDN